MGFGVVWPWFSSMEKYSNSCDCACSCKSVTRLITTRQETYSVEYYVLQAQKGNTVLFIGYSCSAMFAGQESLYAGYLCQCLVCTEPPCEDCAISKTAPHSKCSLCLWKARGRECKPDSLCHGCLKYVSDHPEYIKKAKKLYVDRKRMRETRNTELPVTFTAQEISDNEFCETTEDLSTFLHTGSPSKLVGGESSASTSGGAGY